MSTGGDTLPPEISWRLAAIFRDACRADQTYKRLLQAAVKAERRASLGTVAPLCKGAGRAR